MNDVIQVWRCDLDQGIASPDLLDDKERSRATRFAFEHLQRQYVAAHVFLRSVLASALGVRADALVFDTTEEGKPFLVGHDLAFNLSHAESVAYVAFGGIAPLGIDVERDHHIDDLLTVARTVFSTSEMVSLERAPAHARTALFLRCWTRKEAYVKALGIGLGARLCDITVRSTREDIVVPAGMGISDVPFHIRSIDAPAQDYVAIATMSPPRAVILKQFLFT